MRMIHFVIHIFIICLGYIYQTLLASDIFIPAVTVWSPSTFQNSPRQLRCTSLPLPSCPSLLFSPLQGQSAPPRWKFGSTICQEPRQKVLGTPPPVELHCKKGSLRLTELRPWRHLCSGITILGKRIQSQAWKTTKQFGKNSSHVLAHLLVVREGLGVLLVFPRVSYGFLTANSNICHGIFDKRKFFLRHPVGCTGLYWAVQSYI